MTRARMGVSLMLILEMASGLRRAVISRIPVDNIKSIETLFLTKVSGVSNTAGFACFVNDDLLL